MHVPIRVFVGSGPKHGVEESVMVRSLLAEASRPVDIDIIDCGRHLLRRIGGADRPLPEKWRGRLAGGTVFSFARFAPPELCGYEGRAIYCEADQLVFGDVAELWDLPLNGSAFAAVPSSTLRGDAPPYQVDGHLSSVLVYDCARSRPLSLVDLTDDIRADRLAYSDAISLTDACLDRFSFEVAALPARWNDLERCHDDTSLLHYTDSARQPWLNPHHPERRVWISRYLAAVDAGLIDEATLDSARALDGVSARVRALPRLPRKLAAVADSIWQTAEMASRVTVNLVQKMVAVVRRLRRIVGRAKRRMPIR